MWKKLVFIVALLAVVTMASDAVALKDEPPQAPRGAAEQAPR
ncbi:MAG TPA: hypothetical protein VNO23_10640 [Candidatus Binatia bacterium]|nr:hypothetical protein [Candidatus Binatia bacterium]